MKSQNKSILAAEALTKYRFVDATGAHTADKKAIGVTKFDVDSGDPISFQNEAENGGIVVVEAGGAITAGTNTFVSSDSSGRAVALSLSAVADVEKICGQPIDSASGAGEFIRVKIG